MKLIIKSFKLVNEMYSKLFLTIFILAILNVSLIFSELYFLRYFIEYFEVSKEFTEYIILIVVFISIRIIIGMLLRVYENKQNFIGQFAFFDFQWLRSLKQSSLNPKHLISGKYDELYQKSNKAVNTYQYGIQEINRLFFSIIINLVFVIVAFFTSESITIQFFLVIVGLNTITSLLSFLFRESVYKRDDANQETKLRLSVSLMAATNYNTVSDVIVNDLEEPYEKYIRNMQDKVLSDSVKNLKYSAILGYLVRVIVWLVKSSIIIILFMNITDTTNSIDSLFFETSVILLLYSKVDNFISDIISMTFQRKYVQEFFELLELEDDNKNNIYDISDITLKDVSIIKSDKKILENVNLGINTGDKICIIGENGAGKSTLLNAILGLEEITSGSIYVNEKKVGDSKLISSFTPQDIILFPLDTMDNVIGNHDLDKKRIRELEEQFSLEIKENFNEYSTGQKQRINLMRAIYKKLDLLVVDEPTANLDLLTENKYFKYLQEENEFNITICVSHKIVNSVYFNKILFVSDHEVVEYQSHEDAYENNSKYKEMFDLAKIN